MTVSDNIPGWLVLVFSLPTQRATARVEVWRRLQRYGALSLRTSGYLLPSTPQNRERFQWLAAAVRSQGGEASVLEVQSMDNLSREQAESLFNAARARDYEALAKELRRRLTRRPSPAQLGRIRRKLQQIVEIDFFNSPSRSRLESMLARAEEEQTSGRTRPTKGGPMKKKYLNRLWVTRPRPGIDRVSSAWLIRRFIDPNARFAFANDPKQQPAAIPFDMFQPEGFGHRGDDCTFETLVKEFAIRDKKVRTIAQIIHDADIRDEKYGREEGVGLERVLKGWASQGVPDEELLKRGMNLIEGLYNSPA